MNIRILRILSRKEVVNLLRDGINYLIENDKAALVLELLKHIQVAETRTGARLVMITSSFLQNPENQAMLMALNSREAGGFFANLTKVLKRGAEVFMKTTFLGYGHKSVGDGANVMLWIDGLSMVATKQFEGWPLFSGQETSTRYVDVTVAGWLNPIALEKGADDPDAKLFDEVYGKLFDFYKKALPRMDKVVRERFPFELDPKSDKTEVKQKENYDNTVLAKCCDILGSFLPCGTRTNMSITMNVRQMGEHLQLMAHDPLPEVAWLAEDCIEFLATAYSSFPPKIYPGQAEYWKEVRAKTAYYLTDNPAYSDYHFGTNVRFDWDDWAWALENRPLGCELPKEMRKFGNFRVTHLQDYRSMRDGYRHRDGTNRVPCAVMYFGMEKWYEEQMKFDKDLYEESLKVLAEISDFHSKAISVNPSYEEVEKKLLLYQYIVPMGYRQPCERTITFPSMVYYVELRTGTRVHPTERSVALKVTKSLREHFPKLMLHVNESKSEWDLKRGQDVVMEKHE